MSCRLRFSLPGRENEQRQREQILKKIRSRKEKKKLKSNPPSKRAKAKGRGEECGQTQVAEAKGKGRGEGIECLGSRALSGGFHVFHNLAEHEDGESDRHDGFSLCSIFVFF
ncbi:hypothetical protein BT93_K1886 [Corymbia citriodora subsp. variegata]|nr:hypothetical protein BT93_K1886 [Corymbia citriodora subsp. variegata]